MLANGPRQGATSEKKDLEKKTQNIENFTSRLKKMKSTLPEIGKSKSELLKENQLLRQKASNSIEEIQNTDKLHLGFLFSSPLILKSKSGNKEVYQ